MTKYIIILTLLFSGFSLAKEDPKKLYDSVWTGMGLKYDRIEIIKVIDSISDEPVNTKIHVFYLKTNIIGFAREIVTSTGCNSGCLPVIYTAFYNKQGDFITIKSRVGLTKLNHAPFTDSDYSNLDFILSMENKIFDKIKHPKEMTDALSGATIKKFKPHVVKEAAYTTLRTHIYNLDTKVKIKKYLTDKN